MSDPVQVFVELLDEGTQVWRPTTAYPIGGDRYVLTNQNYDPETEVWAVAPGSIITMSQKVTSASGTFDVAVASEPAQ